MTAPNPSAGTQRSAVEDAAMARERSAYLRSMADHYTDRFHPDISYLLGASNMLGAFADRIEAASAPPSLDVLSDRGLLEQACIAVVGPWFDESHERGSFRPMELAQRILHEYDRAYSEASAEPKDGGE